MIRLHMKKVIYSDFFLEITLRALAAAQEKDGGSSKQESGERCQKYLGCRLSRI